jgi:hypothetical protein
MHKLVIYILVMAYFNSNAQGFRSRYYLPNAKNNASKAIFETTASNYIAGGLILDSAYINKLCIMGLNSQGQLQWTKKYGNAKFMHLDNPFISNSYYKHGNYLYYTGCVLDSNNKQIGVLIKFNLSGDTVWQKIYRDPLQDVVPQMVTASVDGGFLITGFFQTGGVNAMLIKTDANGNELWRQKISKVYPNVQDGKAILQDSASKKIVIVGYQYIGGSSSYNNILILDSLGNKLSQQSWDGNGAGGYLYDVTQTKDKKIVAVGTNLYPQTYAGSNLRGSYIVKFDIDTPTLPIWKVYNFDKPEYGNIFTSLVELPNGNLLVGGAIDTTFILGLPYNGFVRITEFKPNGTLISNKYYNYKKNAVISNNEQFLTAVNLTSDGGWICALQENNYPSPNPFFFVKYDSMGCDSSLAYCASVAAGEEKFMTDDLRFKMYPNPSTGVLTIQLEDATISNYNLKLANVLGQEETTDEVLKQNDIVTLNIQGLKKGIYFLQVFYKGKLIFTEKIIKE